jgi:8-oxo-dGTP pyrophosphatase MutT (NUDIX family)
MHYTIYFNQKPLLLTDKFDPIDKKQLMAAGTKIMEGSDEAAIDQMLQHMQDQSVTGGVIVTNSPKDLLQAFKMKLKVIEAGGGLVYTDQLAILLIFRKGKWDLPKGKLDDGETIAAAAVREVVEETGLTNIQLQEPLITTYHTYYEKEELVLKESHWFLMKSPQQESMIPQIEEDIEKCEWVKPDALAPYLENTHPSIIEVLKTGLEKIKIK